jgi:hypothetical protein
MSERLGEAVLDLRTDDRGLVRGMAKAKKGARGLETRLNLLGQRVQGVAAGFVSLRGAMALAAGATGLFLFAKRAIDAADTIGKTAKAAAISAETLQELRFAARRAGLEVGQLDQAMLFFIKNVAEMKTRVSSELVLALQDFNAELVEGLKNSNNQEEALRLVSDAIANASTDLERAAIARAAFGRKGTLLVEMLRHGSDGLDEMARKARSLGAVLSNETIASAERASDELGDMSDALKIAATRAGLELMPAMRRLAQVMQDPGFLDSLRGLGNIIARLIVFFTRYGREILAVSAALLSFAVLSRVKVSPAISLLVAALAGLAVEFGGLDVGGEAAARTIDDLSQAVKKLDAETVAAGEGASGLRSEVAKANQELALENTILTQLIAAHGRGAEAVAALTDEIELERAAREANVDFASAEGRVFAERFRQNQVLKQQLEGLEEEAKKNTDAVFDLNAAADGLGFAFESAFENAIVAGESFSDVLQGLAQDIQRLLLREFITAQLAGALSAGVKGAFGDFFGGEVAAPTAHTGGRLGADSFPTRILPTGLFAGAPRFSGGGFLKPGEIPAVLHAGEAVFTPGQLKALGGRGGEVKVVINDRRGSDAPPVRVAERFDGRGVREVIVDVLADDARRNGPAFRAIAANLGGRRVGRPR